MKGTKSPIFIDTVPPGAEIEYGGKAYRTPCMIQVAKAYKPQHLQLWLDGYALSCVELRTKAGGMIFGNLFFGGITGIIIDACLASHTDFVQDNFRVELCAVAPGEAAMIRDWREEEKRRIEEEKKLRQREASYAASRDWRRPPTR